jgi:DNA-binding MarR family transcriptional regulator
MAADLVSPQDSPPVQDKRAERRGPTEAAGVDLSPVSHHLGFLVRLVQQRIFDEFHRRFGAEGLTPARYSVLAVLAANPDARQVAVANALQIKPSNMAVLIGALEADGLVERRTDAENRRANMLRLTARGAALHATVAREIEEMDRGFAAHLAPRERAALLAALGRFLQP